MNQNQINLSPWVHELDHSRETKQITEHVMTDVVVVGGGISGLTTAFFNLEHTDKSVILIDAGKIGHGATGHNAGQVVDYFEKPFSEMVDEYGLDMAAHAQKSVSSAWDLLEYILEVSKMNINFSKFIGYAGCTNLEQLIIHFENKRLKKEGGIDVHKVRVSEHFEQIEQIPEKYQDLYEIVPQSIIHELLETQSDEYIAVLQSDKGCLNSASFVEKLSAYLLSNYPERYFQFEHSPVSTIDLFDGFARLYTREYIIDANKVILCTNGFENIIIENYVGADVDSKYHEMVYGRVGFMAAYTEEKSRDPIAISYLPEKISKDSDDPYFYLTRRNYAIEDKSLVCIGGPEEIKQEEFNYSKEIEFPTQVKQDIKSFLDNRFRHTPKDLKEFKYLWHGLMGYTNSGIRCVGPEPANDVLLYNLGCNGVGILPSIFGSKKISEHVNGMELQETLFDPAVQRRVLVKKNILQNIQKFKISEKSQDQ